MKHLLTILLCCAIFATSSYAQEEQQALEKVTVVFSQNKVKMESMGKLADMVKGVGIGA